MFEANSRQIEQCQFFKNRFSQQFKKKLLKHIDAKNYYPGVEINLKSVGEEEDRFICIIDSGSVNVYEQGKDKAQKTLIQILSPGESFGLKQFITTQNQDNLIYVSSGFTSIMVISFKTLSDIIIDFPEDYETFCLMKDTINSIDSNCFICRSKRHDTHQCLLVHYIPDYERLIKSYLYPIKQTRLRFERNENRFKSFFDALNDLELIIEASNVFQNENEEIIDSIFINLPNLQGTYVKKKSQATQLIQDQIVSKKDEISINQNNYLKVSNTIQINDNDSPVSLIISNPFDNPDEKVDQNFLRENYKPSLQSLRTRQLIQIQTQAPVVSKSSHDYPMINQPRPNSNFCDKPPLFDKSKIKLSRTKQVYSDQTLFSELPELKEEFNLEMLNARLKSPHRESKTIELLKFNYNFMTVLRKNLEISLNQVTQINNFDTYKEFSIYKPTSNLSMILKQFQQIIRSKARIFFQFDTSPFLFYFLYPQLFIERYRKPKSVIIQNEQNAKVLTTRHQTYKRKVKQWEKRSKVKIFPT